MIALIGPLGAGKTLFVKGLAEGLQVAPELVSSPTFVIAYEYPIGGARVLAPSRRSLKRSSNPIILLSRTVMATISVIRLRSPNLQIPRSSQILRSPLISKKKV